MGSVTMNCIHNGAEKHFAAAVAAYSRAIDINPHNAVYYSNRAAAHVRLENFGLALTDATKAIEINPQYVKACSTFSHPTLNSSFARFLVGIALQVTGDRGSTRKHLQLPHTMLRHKLARHLKTLNNL